ncbi:Putative Staphylococcal surface anchored protein [Staphylococcus aureus]|nr:Putative Staphylococcal surface anchored protein [Staphylococcus aureus]
MDASAITQATTQVNNAKNGLNGAENLRNAQNTAKQNLNTLSHLTNNQKSAISSQIDRAGHVSEVTAAKNAATELNTQMGNLEQAIHDQNTVKQGVNFTDADKAKRDAYTNAVSRAETILNKTQGANTPKQDVEAAIQSVTSAKNALNGDQNVTNAKNAAKHALNNLTSINNAQKRDLTTKIDQATTVSGVEAVSNTGTQLNTAMANLQNGINDKTNTLASENYHDADSDKKTAYTQAVTNAENILNKNSGSNLDKAAVENALSQVTNAKGALNGNHNLEQAKSNANTTINGLQHLTTAQKDKLKQQVQQAQNVAGVDTVKSSANTLNGAMGTLRNSIQDNAATKNGQNYLDATESNKTNYNNAVDSANGVINATSNPNMDANAINQIATQVTSTKNALDGTHNLTQAKQTATNAIDGATNLNKAQKDALKAQVTSAQRVANVTSIQQTANELNTAMGQLQHGIDDENATKQTQKYRDAEQSKKTAYDQAVAAAKAILNKQTGSNSDKAAVDRALQQVTSTKDALNGDAKLAEAKAAAKQNLGTLNHITNAQRTDLEGQINQATTVDGVNTVKTNANTLDGAMNSLQGSINDKDATLRNQNYLDADESKRNAYTQAVTAAEGILNKQTGGNTSKADVDNALNAVTRAKAALNGADNLRNAKTSATNTINGLPHLTQLQKDNLKHQVEQAQNVAGVNGVKDKGNTLNTAMGALRTSIQNDNTTKTSQNYLDASDINKNNYNTAVNNANGVINATNNPNMDANAINGMANQVNTTKAALNGVQNLAQAKTNATNTINNAHDLNQKQKDALKTQVNNAQRVSDANNVQHTATELNGAMTVLKAAIADKERTKASGNYVNADQEKRQAYDSKVTNAENIINGTPNATLTVNDVNSATSQVNAAKTALNGDNNLRVAKEHANNTIDGLAQLNNAQKAKLKEQVQSATTLDGVQTVKNSSQTLNTAMKGLRDSIANEATIKAGQNYTDASPNNRNEYDSAVTAAKAIINQTSNPTMEPNTITQATSQVTTKEQALNGAQNLAQAKTTAKNNLNNLTSINNAQKDALTRSIDGATTVAGVNQETVKATELNNAMHSLQNGINDETQTKQTQKYLDAEPSKKSAYDQAVNAAKAILTKASGQNVDKAAVEQALQNVNSTKTALNGDAKLNEAKAAAKQTLGTLTHINNAQRTALDNEITQATNVEGVNTVKAKAQQLDGAMGQLETSIRDKDTTLQSQNYQDADDAKRTAYSQAVNAAASILNKTSGGNTPKADVERAMQAVTQANTALNGIQNLERAKQAANTAITNASDLNTKQKEALKAQVTSAGRVSVANGVEHTATELNTAMTALKRAIADKADTKASGNYVNADANKRQAYDEKVTAAENIVSGTPTPTLTPSDVTNAATQVTNAKTQLNGNHNLEVAKQNANTAIDGLTSLNGPQKAKLKEQVGQATTLPNVQTVRDNAQTLNTAMKGLRDSIANEATIKAEQNYTDASPNNRSEYDSAVTAAKAIIGQTSSPTMNAQEINQAKDQVTAKQQALNGQENLTNAQTNAKQHLNGLSDLTNAQKDAAKRQIEGATHVSEVTQAQNNADALNTAMTNLKNGIQDQNTIKQGVNFTDADEAKRNAYTNAVTQAEQILNKVQGPNTAKDNVESALQNVQRAKNDLNGNQNVANAKTTAKNALNNLTSINNAQKEALKSQIDSATTVAGVNQVSATASELNTAMSNLQNGINDEAATKAAQKYTDADSDKQTAYNDAVTAAKTLLDKTAGTNDNKAAVEQALQRVNTAKTALNGDARLNQAKNTAKQQLATMSHLTDAQKANLTSQIERGTTVAGVQGIQANAGTLNEAMNQLRQSIASKDATKASEDYHDANTDLQNAYNDAVTNAEGIISATNNPEMNPDTINQKASQVNSAKSALNGDEKLAAAKQTAKSDIGRLTDLNNAQRTAANAEVDQAPNLAAVTAAKNKATSLNTAMGNLKHALAEKDNTKRSVNYTDADQPKQQAYDTAVTQAEAITNANGSNANETQVQAALNQLNQAKNDLNGDNKVAQAKETAKRALASYSNLNNAQSTAATSQIDNATTVAGVTAAQNTANELNTAMGQLQNGINDQNTVKQQVNFTDADQGKKDAYTNAVTNAQGILDKAHGQNMTKAQVEAALNQVTTAKNALNGDANVRQAKSDAKANLGTLTHLNNAQKQDLTSQIEGATTVNGVNGVKTKAQDLDGAMQRLQSAIANKDQTKASENYIDADPTNKTAFDNAITQAESYLNKDHGANKDKQAVEQAIQSVTSTENALNGDANLQRAKTEATQAIDNLTHLNTPQKTALKDQVSHAELVTGVNAIKQNADALNNAMGTLKQQIQANSQVPQSVDFTQADQDKQQAYNNAANQAQQIANGTPTPVLTPDAVTQAVTTMNQAKDALNGDEKLAQAKQDAIANLDTLRDLNQPQRDALRNQINQAQALATVEQTKQNAQNVNTAMSNLKQGIANKDTVKASENYHDADADKQTAYTNAVSQAEGIINQTTNPMLNPDDITRALTQVTDAKNGLNGEAKLATEKQNAKDAVNAMTHLNDAQKQALKGQIDQSPEIAIVNQVKQTATSLDHAMDQLSQAINDKAQTLADGNYLNADPDKQNAYKQAVAKAEALLNKQSGTNEVQAQVESITNEVNAAKQALNGNDNLANAKQQAKQQLANLTHLNDAQKQSFESQITQAPLVTDVTTINQKAQALDHAMELLRNSVADNQATLASEDYHDATAQRQNDYNQAVTATNNIINQTTSPTMNPDEVNRATTQVNNTKVALDGDENLVAAKQQANNRLDQLDHLNNAQKQQLQSQITQSSDIAAVNGHKQTAESLNTAMGNLINAIADHQTVEQLGNFVNADTDKQTAYTTAVNEAEAMINKQTGQNANQTEVEQAITKVQTTLQALNGDHNLQVAKANATQAIDALTSLNDPQKTALKDQVTAATLVTAVHQIEQNSNTLNQAMHGLRESIQDNAATKANSKYINEDQSEQQNYDQAVQAANNIINEQTATLDNNAINQAATTVNTTKAALHGDVKLQNDKDHAKQTVSQLTHLNNAQKHMEDTLIDSETTRTAVNHDLTEAQALDQLMDALQQSIADKDATRASSAYVNAEPNKKQSYDEAVQNAESIIAGLNNPTINKGNVTSATQAVTSSKNALDGVERLAQDKQTAGNSLNHLDQLTPAQQQALENQINNATTRDKVAEIIAQAQALNEAMKALKESIKDQPQTEASSKFINEDQAQKDAYTQAVQHAKDLINKTTDPTLAKSIIDQATQAVTDAKNNLHGDQKLDQDKQRATETLNNLSNLNTPQRQALENQINNAATRGEVAQKLTEAEALNQAMEALRNSIQDQQQTESGSKFINEDKPQKDAYQAAVQNAKDLINQTGNPTLDKSQVEQLTQAVTTAKDNLHGDQKLARDQQQAVTTVNALPNLNHAQQQALTDAINAAPTRTEVAQHVQTATELDHAMETLKNKVDQVNTDKAQPNYTEASTDKKEAVDQALQAAESITDPTNGSNANKDAVDQALTKLQEKVNELNGNERVAEAKTQAKQTIDQLTHLNADQIATAKQNIDQATKLQPIAELVDQATQLNQSMDQLQQAVNEHANVEQTVDYTQADLDKQNAYKQAIADAENVLKQNANKQQVDQALQNILNAKQALNGDERVALAKTNGKHDIEQLNALNNAQQDGFKGRIDQSNDLNQIQQIVDEAKALNRVMDQLSQEITGNEGRTKGSTNYVNADTQVKQVYDEAVDKAKQALDKSTGQNLTAEQVIKLNDAVTAAKKALNGEEKLNNRKSEALQRLDQLTHLNNAQRQLAIQQINNAETLNKASRAINRATKLDNAMGAVQQYIDEQHLGVISSTNYINADDNLKANYDNAIANAAHELDKVQGNAIAKAEAEQLKQNIIDAQNALNGDQNLANAKDKANAFVNSLNGLNQQQQHLAHNAINNADTVSDVTDIVNNQIDLNDAMETLKHLVDNEIPNAEQTVNYQNAEDNAKTNFDDAKRLANTLLNSDNTNVNDINGAIQTVNDAIQNLNGDQRLQDAKDKAIQSINQALANKLKEIEASNATDQDKLIAKNKAEELANSIINNINKATSNQDVSQVQTAGNHAIEQVHANEIPKAKIDANKDVDKQVQALIDEIDRNPILTDKEKQALKDRINQILQQGHNDINNAMTKEEIEQAKAQLAQALQDIKDLVKAKESAKQDIDKQVQALIDEIDRNPILTDKEKQALKDRINQILQQGHNGINNAMTKEEIEQAKAQLGQALQDIKDLVKAKESAKQDIDKQVQALIDEIDRNPNLTDKEKQALKDRINQILQQGHNGINNAMTKEEIEHAKAQLAQALQDIKDLVKAKEDAKNAIKALANAKRDQINSNPDLTLEQKAKALKEIDEAEKRALENIENAQTKDQLNQGLNLGLDDIRNTHVWEVDAQPAVNEIFDATPEQILVNGELIVHRDDIITEQDILAHINLIDQLTAEIIDTPSTATISDSLTAKVEVTLLDGSKVIVNVPVKVVEKELTVVKQQAIESIENAAQQKINEINNHATLTPEQKEAAIAEVNKLKQQAIEQINNAADVHTVEEVQHQEQAHIEQFNPDQFTIDQAKSNAIKSISDAIQHMIDEINASKDLTDKEKQEAISKLNQLKDQSIQAIQRAQSIDEIAQQLEQFKAQLKAANPFAKELENRKKAAISKIKDISTDKIDRIRNSTIGTAEERQAAMNRINEIVLETIKDINNAQTPQQVEAALNNGIARILAVQIVTSDHSKPSSNSDGQSNSHLHVGYGTVNHPFNSSPIGHKKKLDQDDEIDPLHMRHFGDRIGNVIKNALGVVGISGLLASFWFFIAKRRRKEDEEEELEIRDNSKDKKKGSIEGTKHLPLLFAKRRRKEDEEDAIVEEKDSLNNDESLDKVKHTPFFLPKRRRKEDEEDVEVTNENTDEKVLQDNEHSPVLIAKRLKDKDGNVETTTSIESKDEDVPLLLAKKKNQKDNQSKGKKSASKKPSKKVAAKKKKKKSKKNKK